MIPQFIDLTIMPRDHSPSILICYYLCMESICLHGIVANMLDCNIVVSDFELQFEKGIYSLISPAVS